MGKTVQMHLSDTAQGSPSRQWALMPGRITRGRGYPSEGFPSLLCSHRCVGGRDLWRSLGQTSAQSRTNDNMESGHSFV